MLIDTEFLAILLKDTIKHPTALRRPRCPGNARLYDPNGGINAFQMLASSGLTPLAKQAADERAFVDEKIGFMSTPLEHSAP